MTRPLPIPGSMFLAAILLFAPPAARAASQFHSPQVTLSLAAEAPSDDGQLRAALLIDLAPGWKTYWIDPGDAGIPPGIDLSASRNLVVQVPRFPAPRRLPDEFGVSNGYSEPMAVALELTEALPGEATEIRARITLGVCRTICIPISTELDLRPDDAGSMSDGRIRTAFEALPKARDGANSTGTLSEDGQSLSLALRSAGVRGGEAIALPSDIFVSGPKGWTFGAPARLSVSNGVVHAILPVGSRPRKAGTGPLRIDVVVAAPDHASEFRDVSVRTAP